MAERPRVITRQAQPTNSGLHLHDTPSLLRSRAAFRRLLEQMESHGAGDVAIQNVERYLLEADEALAARETGVAA